MTFDELIFDHRGCCGTHKWAEVKHGNGNVSSVYENEDGTFDVVTHAANMLIRGQERYQNQASVLQRLAEDAS